MKFIWIACIFMVAFNGMTLFTNSLEIFQVPDITPSMSETDLENYSNISKNPEEIGGLGILGFELTWANAATVILSGLTLAGAVAIAIYTHSPIPLAVGGMLSFTVAFLANTLFVLQQFGINQIFLLTGFAGLLIVFIMTTVEVMAQQAGAG